MTVPSPGDPAPWFTAATLGNPRFRFDTAAGRYVVLCFFGSAGAPTIRALLDRIRANRLLFDDAQASFFGVSADPRDRDRLEEALPGIHFFHDFDLNVSRLYGLVGEQGRDGARRARLTTRTFLLDPMLRVVDAWPVEDPVRHVDRIVERLAGLPRLRPRTPAPATAPVLMVPGVFEPEFCRRLIGIYDRDGGADSGFMREQDGRTVMVVDHRHKRRSDCLLDDIAIQQQIRARFHRRLVPEIRKAFMFEATRLERYVVSCYDADSGGHFRAHRDNTTKGTAHRRFAVTLNLNEEEYEGGDLWFPEFGPYTYRAPTGGAIVFACSLLHEALPVSRGRRYVFLPFLYDEKGQRVREANARYVDLQPPAEGAD